MAQPQDEQHDALILLRSAIANNTTVLTGTSDDINSISPDLSLAKATHLHFTSPQVSLPLSSETRFISADIPVSLRSIFFAWQNREAPIPAYAAAVVGLNSELAKESHPPVKQLAFVERLDLITWLEGGQEESEYIKPLAAQTQAAGGASLVQGKTDGKAGEKKPKVVSERLMEIYQGERRMGDRNSVLRGIKPTDFSHVRKMAQTFIKARSSHGDPRAQPQQRVVPLTKPARRPDPIILVSPSASALLRMSNIKSFLESGVYIPADSSLATTSSSASILHISRLIPAIDPSRPIRFIVVDSPEQFKPEYWARVVCVFTTGQAWQFKNYKWADPSELFRHSLGVYVGWRGENVPDAVRGWGRGVMNVQVDQWMGTTQGRWRDREAVEGVWRGIEECMRGKGWTRDSGPRHA